MYTGYKQLLIEKCDKILKITFNNPSKKNSLNPDAYDEIGRVLRVVAKDDSITIVVFTGVGDFFTAGNDLSLPPTDEDLSVILERNNRRFKEMVAALIDCPKIMIALVNGPSIGIGATLAALCDMVWCTENAYFLTPFTKLGLVPEACSSYTFPLIIGRSKAAEMLLFSQKMSSKEAYDKGFVSKIYSTNDLNSIIWPQIKEFSELPPISMLKSKALMRGYEKDLLYKVLNSECDELKICTSGEEFINAVLSFVSRKNKSNL